MEYNPICIECNNFEKNDYCPHFQPIPFEIKNREKKCKYYSGGSYILYGENAYKEKGDLNGK